MELHQLRYFAAVAELESFTRAAERCLVSQPSLSQQIIKLEKELGQPLFERLGRKILLTDAGRALYQQARQILDAVEEARHVCDGVAGHGKVAVGAIPTVAPYLLPPLLRQFARDFPAAEVIVREDVTERTVEGCLAGELDVALLALPIDDQMLRVEPLFEEELFLALPAGHPFARKKRVTADDLRGEPFILLNEAHCLGGQMVSFCRNNGFQPVMRCRSAQLLTVQELVGLGQGISLIPAMARQLDRSRDRVYRSLAPPRPTRTLAVVWHRHRVQSPLVQRFIEIARRHRQKGDRVRGDKVTG
jgi:LysR family hydrogen peroxide-inducible transcriptional activator